MLRKLTSSLNYTFSSSTNIIRNGTGNDGRKREQKRGKEGESDRTKTDNEMSIRPIPKVRRGHRGNGIGGNPEKKM